MTRRPDPDQGLFAWAWMPDPADDAPDLPDNADDPPPLRGRVRQRREPRIMTLWGTAVVVKAGT